MLVHSAVLQDMWSLKLHRCAARSVLAPTQTLPGHLSAVGEPLETMALGHLSQTLAGVFTNIRIFRASHSHQVLPHTFSIINQTPVITQNKNSHTPVRRSMRIWIISIRVAFSVTWIYVDFLITRGSLASAVARTFGSHSSMCALQGNKSITLLFLLEELNENKD